MSLHDFSGVILYVREIYAVIALFWASFVTEWEAKCSHKNWGEEFTAGLASHSLR